ncbi:hypothetical protein MTYP_01834 [Methylophilaceae bacterium]|nr:hypothetical protein MTYP_01834 [Methylophilaceae bacterium]
MEWLWIVAFILVVLGLLGLALPVLPGVPLLFGGLLMAAWIDDFARVGTMAMIVIGILALLAWIIDIVASLITTKSAGASRQALAGTVIGALVGILGGLPGIILGTVAGAAIGEILANRDPRRATKIGVAAGLGFVLALAFKLLFAALMLGIFAYAYFV